MPDTSYVTHKDDDMDDISADTCYVPYKGDSLLVVVTTTRWFPGGDMINYCISFANRQFRLEKDVNPLMGYIGEKELTMSQKRDGQRSRYLELHRDSIARIDSIIAHLLPEGADAKIKESYPWIYRIISFDIDKDGYIIAVKLNIRNSVQFILFGGVQGCGDILKAFIGKRLPAQQFPTLGNGFQMEFKIFWDERGGWTL